MLMNRFFKNTLGVQAEVIIAQSLDANSTSPVGGNTSHKNFIANAAPGALGVFFSDTMLQVPAGGTSLAANANRSFFYAWKQADGFTYRTTDIPCLPVYTQLAYNAGQPQIGTITVGGTINLTQILHVRITDRTPDKVPFPSFEYQATVTVDVPTALAAIVKLINAETVDPIVTATSAGNVITLTGIYNTRTFVLSAFLEVTGAQPTDLSAFTFATTQKAVGPVGTTADVTEFETYFIEQQGGVLYTDNLTLPKEFQTMGTAANSNVLSSIQYGYVIVRAVKTRFDNGATRRYDNKAYIIVALPTANVATLAAN